MFFDLNTIVGNNTDMLTFSVDGVEYGVGDLSIYKHLFVRNQSVIDKKSTLSVIIYDFNDAMPQLDDEMVEFLYNQFLKRCEK